MADTYREIPFNYTSAGDETVVRLLLGHDFWTTLQALRSRRVTGRSARLLMRVIGALFVVHRNVFVREDLVRSGRKLWQFLTGCRSELKVVEGGSGGNPEVMALVDACRRRLADLEREVRATPARRRRLIRVLGEVVGRENVVFDPITLVSHATDATDWRLHLPMGVVFPTREEQVPALLRHTRDMGLAVIPRGAGTGLTGGAVPVRQGCLIINTEKLNRIRDLQEMRTAAGDPVCVLELEAGVVTQDAMRYAERHGWVFAVDPTSAWACTIGGNIAENAGGKTAVLWGTTLDNLVSFRVVQPDGRLYEVRRLDHPLRKVLPGDVVRFGIYSEDGRQLRVVQLASEEIRRSGLWKDITNKWLGGVPGLQKEGTDGVITSARFVLHRPYPCKSTWCLEFFGEDLEEAGRVIGALAKAFENRGQDTLMALEHFDEEYVRAIGYRTKAPRGSRPKAVLLLDLVAWSNFQLEAGEWKLQQLLEACPDTASIHAESPEQAAEFWRDRRRLGAIAARTNAFKLNEDIVLPLDALPAFARFVEAGNQREERHNQRGIITAMREELAAFAAEGDGKWLEAKRPGALDCCRKALRGLARASSQRLRDEHDLDALRHELGELLGGYSSLLQRLDGIRERARSRRIVIATHMHAGDGNVHVNIPVFSNDREMMERAYQAADAVMAEAVRLGGVVSGEHGIGFTKLKYLEPERIAELDRYRREVDPDGLMNPGKLSDRTVPALVFTPSFNLLELEARILQYGSLESLSERIARCVRCGKCKPDCCVFHPEGSLFFHPRNKNLAVGAVIEALLFNTQRFRDTSMGALGYLLPIADHCTICHKCLRPCPVDIDTGAITIQERELLAEHRMFRGKTATRISLGYLESRSPWRNRWYRPLLLRFGAGLQQAAAQASRPWSRSDPNRVPGPLRSPMTPADPTDLWAGLPRCNPDQALVLHPRQEPGETVLYFPGCGSERLFSRIGKATVYLLLDSGYRVVLPPPSLCCGFPFRANARTAAFSQISLRNSIILTQIREMMRYLEFAGALVSCGTCREALHELGAEEILGCRLADAAGFLLERRPEENWTGKYLYHAPCHDSLEGQAVSLLGRAARVELETVPHCCSEAGTLALSRPELSDAMLRRKREALEASRRVNGLQTILTNCPSCLQGLGRLRPEGFSPRHILEEMVVNRAGEDWQRRLPEQWSRAEAVVF